MSPKKDYYEVLGVPGDAKEVEIKRAYRKLARQYHPDVEGGNRDKFDEVDAAYQTLRDAGKRAVYDRFGSSPPPEGNGLHPSGSETPSPWGDFGFNALFKNWPTSQSGFFGADFGTPTPKKAEDHLDLRINDVGVLVALIEAYSSPTDGKWEVSRPKEDTRNLPESMYRVSRVNGEVWVFRKINDWRITDRNGEVKYGYGFNDKVKTYRPDTYFNEGLFHHHNARFQDAHIPSSYYPYLQALKTIAKKMGQERNFEIDRETATLNQELRYQSGTHKETGAQDQPKSSMSEMTTAIKFTDLGTRLKAAEELVRRIDGNRTPEGQTPSTGEQKG